MHAKALRLFFAFIAASPAELSRTHPPAAFEPWINLCSSNAPGDVHFRLSRARLMSHTDGGWRTKKLVASL